MGARTQGKGIRRPPGEPLRRAVVVDEGEKAHLRWTRRNYVILAAGGGAIVLGFVLLALGDKTLAPILLVGGYLGLIPWGILTGERKKAADKHPNGPGE